MVQLAQKTLSGGPLVCKGELQGIISWGGKECGAVGETGIYTKVCKFNDLLKSTMALGP